MHYLPEVDCEIPDLDLLTLLFESSYPWAREATTIYAASEDETNNLTKAQVRTTVRRLAHVLRHEFGVGAQGPEKDIVICISSNQLLLPTIFFAVIGAEGIFSAASTAFTVPELVRQIEKTGSNLIVTSEDTLHTALGAARHCHIPLERVLILQSMGHKRQLKKSTNDGVNYLTRTAELQWERITNPQILERRVVALLFSSGTTGVPKAVCLSHKNFVAEAIITQAAIQMYLNRAKRQIRCNFRYRTIAHLPTAHIAGLQGYFINGIMAGGTVFWMAKFIFEDFLCAAKKHSITFLTTAPPVYLQIVKSSKVTDHFHSLLHAQSGAAPIGSDLLKLAQEKLRCNISQAWGLTETTGAVTWLPWDRSDLTASISQLLPNTRMKIVDDNDAPVEEGQRGEILVKGPNVTKGYFQNPEATEKAFTTDGWLRTGDIGLRKKGLFYIVDRKKELTKYKGLQIAPAEIEVLLVGNRKILDAAVIGVQDPKIPENEVPCAFIVQDPNEQAITVKEIDDYIRKNLADHKRLRGGVVFVDQIPKNMSGKILRRELVEKARAGKMAKL
ncbi:hypothetical protein BDV59DRAFT_190649 [Aspergillus ambiguus]|uniref:uncharacterized protein n=1 Tax=Aspergillus ambiguus TaxID=176160 RepID=UPI003CCDFAA3